MARWMSVILVLVSIFCNQPCARAATGTIQDVQHVVILMQENRSFDHYFGTLHGVRGFNDPNILLFQNAASDLFQPNGGSYVLPFQVTNACISDVGHGEEDGLNAWNNGWWNGWIPNKGSETMAYYTRTNLSFYYALADAYTICDDNFCSFTGPTFPNRIYLFTGMIDPNGTGGGPVLGNDVPSGGYSWTTYPERLQAAGVSWKVYRPNGDWFGDALQWFAPFMNASPGNPLYDRGMAEVNDVVAALAADATNGTLPQVSWIIPTDLSVSEHPPYSIETGEQFVQSIMTALAANPAVWNSTVFIITYDENGGFFDHVPPPVPPPGTTNEFVNGSPLGLGIRVPMLIISPWTRGGRVCSQVFDHTSIIRFLETWTGVQEPNISAWRRQTCGDLTSAFNFADPDTSIPNLPLNLSGNFTVVTPAVPADQLLPVQESGTRTACPLPYQPDAFCQTDCFSNRLFISMTNAGTAAVHFSIYPNASRTDGPWQYDAPPGGLVNDSFLIPSGAGGQYDFTCYGPNGFQRRFAGNVNSDCNQIETASVIDPVGGTITVELLNPGANPASFTITNNLIPGGSWIYFLPPVSSTNQTFPAVASNNGWYDLSITASNDVSFLRHLAGHIENGAFSQTSTTAIVGNPYNVSTTNIVSAVNPVIGSINDQVNYLIAHNSLATAGTNSLAITFGSYGGNCALIYPGWASNYLAESCADLASGSWTPLNTTPSAVSNCNVIILPETNTGCFFRLHL